MQCTISGEGFMPVRRAVRLLEQEKVDMVMGFFNRLRGF
jgi:hypothetical protein